MRGFRSFHHSSVNPNIKIIPKCEVYNKDLCAQDCTDEWRKCGICKKNIPFNNERFSIDKVNMNSYVIYSAESFCDDFNCDDIVLIICPNCFNNLKNGEFNKNE